MASVSPAPPISRVLIFSLGLSGGLIAAWMLWGLSFGPKNLTESHPMAGEHAPKFSIPSTNLEGKAALEADSRLLREGFRRLLQTADYTGTFRRQERVDGILDKGSVIRVKSRRQPLSLYLKWIKGDAGRELLFVEGQNDGEMVVRLGGLRGRLLPALKIHPDGETARREARHHISQISLYHLVQKVLEHTERDLENLAGIKCELIVGADEQHRIRVERNYESPQVNAEYRKAIHWLDRETLLPVKIKTYDWPEAGAEIPAEELDAQTLLEDYEYSDLQFDHQFTEDDFSRENPNYSFRR